MGQHGVLSTRAGQMYTGPRSGRALTLLPWSPRWSLTYPQERFQVSFAASHQDFSPSVVAGLAC